MARAMAPESVAAGLVPATAKARPTASPSGMLCSVTASTKSVVRRSEECSPSGLSSPRCIWGSSRSSSSKNATPRRKPPPAGTQGASPCSSAISIAGIKSDQTEAAVMTPAANPRKTRCTAGEISFRNKNTIAAPATVARQVNPVPSIAIVSGVIICSFQTNRRRESPSACRFFVDSS